MGLDIPTQMRESARKNASRCAATNIRKASRAISQFYDHVLEPSGLKSTQLTLLIGIVIHAPIVLTALAERMVMDRTTLTRDLQRLEQQGMIEINAGTDKRAKIIELTQLGQTALMKAAPLRAKAQKHIETSIGEARLSALLETIEEVVVAVKSA
jgi:DNA-binding MarR family transcriptional regulator